MTQHFIAAKMIDGSEVSVMTGYDRPLDCFFLLIQRDKPLDDDDEGIVYTEMDSPDPTPRDFAIITKVLSGFGIVLPQRMINAINEDFIMKRGNAITVWNADGEVIPPKPKRRP